MNGLMKKFRGQSHDSDNLESSGFIKKQTPISDRSNQSSNQASGGIQKLVTGNGFNSVRDRFDSS